MLGSGLLIRFPLRIQECHRLTSSGRYRRERYQTMIPEVGSPEAAGGLKSLRLGNPAAVFPGRATRWTAAARGLAGTGKPPGSSMEILQTSATSEFHCPFSSGGRLPRGYGVYVPDLGGVNQCFLGGNDIGASPDPFLPVSDNDRVGPYWFNLDADSITVRRRNEDTCVEKVRIRIWNFWTPIQPSPGEGRGLAHYSNLDPARMLVDLQLKDSGLLSIGMHQRGLGGMDWTNGDRLGAYWGLWTGG